MNPRLLLLALLSLVPTTGFGAPSSSADSAAHLGLGVTRAEIQTMYERPEVGFRFDKPDFECPTGFVRDRKTTEDMCVAGGPGAGSEDGGRIKGAPRVMGYAPTGDRTTALFLVGPPDDIQKASLMLTFLPSHREQWPVNILYAGALLEEILGWPGGTDWVMENVPKAVEGGAIELRRGNRLVRVSATAGMPIVFVSVEAVESPESIAARQAAERRADGARAIAEGDGLRAAGSLTAAITAWDVAARIPETATEARSRQAHAWVQVAAELATSDTNGAMKALDAAVKVAPTSEAGKVEREAVVVRVALARSLAESSPEIAHRVLAASTTAQASDPALFRAVTVAAADASCSDASLTLYQEAGELAPLSSSEGNSAGKCALSLASDELAAGKLLAARQYFDASRRWAPGLDGTREVERVLGRAERKAARSVGRDADGPKHRVGIVVGLSMLGGGLALIVPAIGNGGTARAIADELATTPHDGSEVTALVAQGESAEIQGAVFGVGATVLTATGFGLFLGEVKAAQDGQAAVIGIQPGRTPSITLTMAW